MVLQLAREAEVERLIAKHGLSRALAMQVARGEVRIEDVLRKARQQEYMATHRDRSLLNEVAATRASVAVAVHGARVLRGKVDAVETYDVLFTPEGEAQTRIPKVQIKFAYDPAQYKQFRKNLRYDAAHKGARDPILRPQDRYGCSDRRLFRYLDSGVTVAATTLEGEILSGKVAWMSRWEFCLKLDKTDAWVVVWRHALADITEAR